MRTHTRHAAPQRNAIGTLLLAAAHALLCSLAPQAAAYGGGDPSAPQADRPKAVLFTDRAATAAGLAARISRSAGLDVSVSTACQYTDPRAGGAAERAILSDPRLRAAPAAVLLQLGCGAPPDPVAGGEDAWLAHYSQTLFDFPTGNVCTLTGKLMRHKRIAVARDQVAAADLAGSIFRIVAGLRRQCPDTRVFLLSPSLAADAPQPPATDAQLRLVAQMLCVPYVASPDSDLAPYAFVWDRESPRPQLGRVLILGDSYSEQRRWTDALEDLCDARLVNLGVGSATLRDRHDHTASAYTSRPVKTDSQGNRNTLACQLEQLKRLLRGGGDSGEPVLAPNYQPDAIVIEGGTNDSPDPDDVEARYADSATQADRTTFVGALAHLAAELRALFPAARIYAATPSGLYYGHTDAPFDYIRKARQIRRAARLLHIRTIDWDREGRLSFVFNNARGTGDGTLARPFRYNAATDETRDLLHPNERGGRFLAECALKALRAPIHTDATNHP